MDEPQLHKLNPNQFALPGLEQHAHPWAGQLAKGLMLSYEHSPSRMKDLEPKYHADFGKRVWVPEEHSLTAHEGYYNPESTKGVRGHLDWLGKDTSGTGGMYPGEIQYVEGDEFGEHKGVGQALYHSAHHFDFGQNTVPTHSPIRTDEGEKFAHKVGGQMPVKSDVAWRPEEGTHPYEWHDRRRETDAAAKMVKPKQAKGQGRLDV